MIKHLAIAIVMLACATIASADTFGRGSNQFTIDFVPIAGDAGNLGSWPAGDGYEFTGVNRNNYRMGTFEITNDQWNKFINILGMPLEGNPHEAYNEAPKWTGANVPTNNVSWLEAAQFVNWLNTSKGHPPAYRFIGTQGMSNYVLRTWPRAYADNGSNLYRHKDAVYYLPTEDEWVKAAYWNGTELQTHATKLGEILHQGDGTNGTGWNYYDEEYATDPSGPWDVGSGSEELNGTYDIMGNVWELIESPHNDPMYGTQSGRGKRGGAFGMVECLESSLRSSVGPANESWHTGFRVAADVIPEPSSLVLLSLGGLTLIRKRQR